MRTIRTDRAPAPVQGAPYSQGVAVRPGEIVYVSGQVPLDAAGTLVGDDIRSQTTQVLANIAAILFEAGAGLEHIVKTTVFLTDLAADFGPMNEVYGATLAPNAPARATVGVAALPLGARVEIEAIAVLPA